jgi:light-regulated signal transduction histidine kinase (bacteriophytochrome)
VASHDLQEPLRKVAGFCQLLEKRYGDQLDERGREYIWFASDGARRMQDLINDLLAFSRVGRNNAAFVPVDLTEVAAEVVEMFAEPIAETGATVDVAPLPTVHGDRRLLAAVFQNLVSNALKFRGEDPPRVDIACERDGDHWSFAVTDNGIGIEPEYADQIFTIFKRLHNKADYEGTGIGLALCKKIVEFHGGRVGVEPGSGGGSTFTFTLPVGDDAEPAPSSEKAAR